MSKNKQKPKIIGDRKWVRYLTVVVSVLGLGISLYAYYVEKQLEADRHYKPLCDISKEVRCSTALSSKYGMGFGFLGSVFGDKHMLNQPNTLFGAVFYALMAGLGYARNSKASLVQLNLAFISVFVSAYLAYNLFFNLKELCPVCIATYVVNILLLLLSIFKGKPHVAEPVRHYKNTNGKHKKTDEPTEDFPELPKHAEDTTVHDGPPSPGKSYAQAAKPSYSQAAKLSNKK